MMFSLYEHSIKHHLDRAEYWRSQGKPDYAAGSMRKAAKWQDKARALDLALNGAMPKDKMHDFMGKVMEYKIEQLSSKFVGLIFNGPTGGRKAFQDRILGNPSGGVDVSI